MKTDITKRLAYLRNRYRTAGIRLAAGKFEVFNTAPASLHVWKQVDTLDEAVDLANRLVAKHNDSLFNVWSPDQQHVYQVENRGGELEVNVEPLKAKAPAPKKGPPVDKRPWDEQMAEYWQTEKKERTGQKVLVAGGVYRFATREGVPEGLEDAVRDSVYYYDEAMVQQRRMSPESLKEIVRLRTEAEDLLNRVKSGRMTYSDDEVVELEKAVKNALDYLDGAFRHTQQPEALKGLHAKRRRLDTLLEEVSRMRTGTADPVPDVGFDGFIGVFDPDVDRKRDYADRLMNLREQRTTLPVVVDDDVMPVHGGKTKKRRRKKS
jgi:hypothetical protein